MFSPFKLRLVLITTMLLGLVACKSGGDNIQINAPASVDAKDFSVGSYAITLSVDPNSSAGSVGTKTISLTRASGFTSPITLSVGTLPSGVKAGFAQATITGGSAELSIEAGYPDPSDPTFTKQILPAEGSYSIPIIASGGGEQATGYLNLTVDSSIHDFAVGLFTVNGTKLSFDSITTLSLRPIASLSHTIAAYVSAGSYSDQPLTLSAEGLPEGLHATFDSTTVSLNDMHTLTLQADWNLSSGTYSFRIKALHSNGQARYLPLFVDCSSANFWIQPETATPSVVQGGSISFPLQLGRNDVFFDGSVPPVYLPTTTLSAATLPAGLSVTFGDTSPTSQATVPLTLSADAAMPPGTYNILLNAVRGGTSALSLSVAVTTATAAATTWIQRVEWGQGVLESNLPLIPGKAALLRVHLLADRSGVTLPALTARLEDGSGGLIDTLTFSHPATLPIQTLEGDLATTCNVLVPGADIQPGMKLLIQSNGTTLGTSLPVVENTGYVLPLTIVPIVHKGVAPSLPSDSDIQSRLLAYWPLQGVTLRHRAPYTTATVIPTPDANATLDHSGDGWSELLTELAALRMIDGSAESYYGMFNLGLPASFHGSTTIGLHSQGQGAGLGIDSTTAVRTGIPLMEVLTMVHELGHGFNLGHAPVGGVQDAMTNYPYEGASIGSWGYDPATSTLYDPSTHFDIMGYTDSPQWVSDWCYLAAMGFVRNLTLGGSSIPLPLITSVQGRATSDQLLVSGWQGPDGQVHLAPLVQTLCESRNPDPGTLELRLEGRTGARRVAFQAEQVADLPRGYRHFAFTVPVGEELTQLEIRSGSQYLLRKQVRSSLATRAQALAKAVPASQLLIDAQAQVLHLRWDALVHPYVTVVHEGATRTTLAMHLGEGSADLDLRGLPAGGHFVLHYSDGLNTLKQSLERP